MTAFEFHQRFPTEEAAINFIVEKKYPHHQYVCPKCGCTGKKIYRQHYNRKKLACKNCATEFSPFADTIFEGTHLSLRMWLYAINLINVSRKGISALQLQRELGMKTYASALRMLRKIREAMGREDMREVFEGIAEVDETYVGGRPRKKNYHAEPVPVEEQPTRGRGTSKAAVIGVYERRTGKAYFQVTEKNGKGQLLSGEQLLSVLNHACKPSTTVVTDQFHGYDILDKPNPKSLRRVKVDHSQLYSLGNGVHTNGIESCWALMKRTFHGTHHHVSARWRQSYVVECAFRLSNRNTEEAFEKLVGLAVR